MERQRIGRGKAVTKAVQRHGTGTEMHGWNCSGEAPGGVVRPPEALALRLRRRARTGSARSAAAALAELAWWWRRCAGDARSSGDEQQHSGVQQLHREGRRHQAFELSLGW